MKTIRDVVNEKNPPKKEDEYYFHPSGNYEDAYHDCEILVWESVGSYQGDYIVLVRDPNGAYGFHVIGYGSCSGCDAMQACNTIDQIVELLEGTRSGTHWEQNVDAMRDYLTVRCDREMKDTYMSDEKERKKVWRKLLRAVAAKEEPLPDPSTLPSLPNPQDLPGEWTKPTDSE